MIATTVTAIVTPITFGPSSWFGFDGNAGGTPNAIANVVMVAVERLSERQTEGEMGSIDLAKVQWEVVLSPST